VKRECQPGDSYPLYYLGFGQEGSELHTDQQRPTVKRVMVNMPSYPRIWAVSSSLMSESEETVTYESYPNSETGIAGEARPMGSRPPFWH